MIKITQDIINDVSEGFRIPSIPEVLLDVRRICADPEGDISQLAAIISKDIGLSAAILKTVNSSLYGMNRAISDINQAVMLLGMGSVSTLITGILIKQSFQGKAAISFERLWDNATFVAEAMVFIGKNVDKNIPREDHSKSQVEHENDNHNTNHAVVGYYIASGWKLPKDIRHNLYS